MDESVAAEEIYKTAFDLAAIGIALTGLDGRYLRVNRSLCEITGYSEAELLVKTVKDLTHPDDVEFDTELRRRLVAGETGSFTLEKRFVRRSGEAVWVRQSTSLLRDPSGKPVHFIGQYENITDRRAAEERLIHQALHDPLTGLNNRILFMDRLTHALARSGRHLTPVAVLFVDLDHFKSINDLSGHQAGDEVLAVVARKLESVVRPADTVARIGGDEFAVLCEDMSGESDAVLVAERLCKALYEPIEIGGKPLSVSASIGIAFAQEGDDPDTLLRHADAAMYKVKEGGRGTYEIFLDAL